MNYQQYLKSSQWKALRQQAILRSGGKCELCGSRKHLVVHHTKYPKVLGEEHLDTLQCLCEDCHNVKCHGGSPANHKLTKQEKRQRKLSRKKAKFAGPVKIYTQDEIRAVNEQYTFRP